MRSSLFFLLGTGLGAHQVFLGFSIYIGGEHLPIKNTLLVASFIVALLPAPVVLADPPDKGECESRKAQIKMEQERGAKTTRSLKKSQGKIKRNKKGRH